MPNTHNILKTWLITTRQGQITNKADIKAKNSKNATEKTIHYDFIVNDGNVSKVIDMADAGMPVDIIDWVSEKQN